MSALPPETVMQAIAKGELKTESPKGTFTKFHKLGLGIISGLVFVAAVTAYLIYASYHETADDAYTTGNIHNISSRVAGTVVEVAVDDNEFVKKDQALVRLDRRDFQVQVDKARADYQRAKADFDRATVVRNSQDALGLR